MPFSCHIGEDAVWRMSLEFYWGVCVCVYGHARVCLCVRELYIENRNVLKTGSPLVAMGGRGCCCCYSCFDCTLSRRVRESSSRGGIGEAMLIKVDTWALSLSLPISPLLLL